MGGTGEPGGMSGADDYTGPLWSSSEEEEG